MYPTLDDGDRLIILKLGKSTSSVLRKDFVPKRGEIIVFNDPFTSERQIIKRVIGLPGERVVLENGVLTVYNDQHPNGFQPDLEFDYDFDINTTKSAGNLNVRIPNDQIFVSGDNRRPGASLDSRSGLGNIPLDKVVGTTMLRVFPLSKTKIFL